MFNDKQLIKKHGSWIRVQVAFYDFIFQKAAEMCPHCFKDKCIEEICSGMADGEDIYEKTIKAIEQAFPTFDAAWEAFKMKEKS